MAEALRPTAVSVLIVEDSTEDTELIVLQLRSAGLDPTFRRVESRSGMIAALEEQEWDLVLCDYLMPHFDPADALAILQELRRDTPFLIVSGRVHDEAAVSLMQRGARDIVMKSNLARLGPVVLRELETIAARREAREALRESDERFALFMQNLPGAAWMKDTQGRYVYANATAERMFQTPLTELRGKTDDEIFPSETAAQFKANDQMALSTGKSLQTIETLSQPDGVHHSIVSKFPIFGKNGAPILVGGIAIDITDRKRLEERLRHAQRLESLGLLAGSMAHDFNNLLTVIMANASLALSAVSAPSPNRRLLEEVVDAAQRTADLTHQLLAYAGKAPFDIQPIDLSQLVRQSSQLVRMPISGNVQLKLDLVSDLPPVEADIVQVNQVLMNLVVNGAEAIGEGKPGTVLVATRIQDLRPEDIGADFLPNDIVPGRYVTLEVRDTGSGMDETTQARIFDPFFTTKFAGRGLGLSAVLGIVRGHGGALKVYSVPGQGAAFTAFFPAGRVAPIEARQIERAQDLHGAGTILVVDDEPAIRQVARTALERYGYTVLVADNGRAAVDLFRARSGEISLVLLDLTMPVMGGEEALRHLRTMGPDIPVILSSGFSDAEALQQFGQYGLAAFLHKPYTVVQLAGMVKTVLERSVIDGREHRQAEAE